MTFLFLATIVSFLQLCSSATFVANGISTTSAPVDGAIAVTTSVSVDDAVATTKEANKVSTTNNSTPLPISSMTKNCLRNQFMCDKRCISKSLVCDGIEDCLSGEDEANCALSCGKDKFRCRSDGVCLDRIKYCDGVTHCVDGSDEQNVRNFQAKMNAEQHEIELTWEDNCALLSKYPQSYVITWTELTTNTTNSMEVVRNETKTMSHNLKNILDGAMYNISISTNATNATPITLKISGTAPLPPVHRLQGTQPDHVKLSAWMVILPMVIVIALGGVVFYMMLRNRRLSNNYSRFAYSHYDTMTDVIKIEDDEDNHL
ncbi:sortilin-related receptor-like isoform X1 [Contarinia nasturtii]|uniref:sortilin-related receptor-like isoform X1 n=1 Tax=Contarinia nasturtii TaxID=265458 RepID=UPI0012D4AEEE|nr:sortilin-related receptor-like isoform X1 [Contarinia nasturtii]